MEVAEFMESAAVVRAYFPRPDVAWSDVADAWEGAGIAWCTLCDDAAEGGDVDVLVGADDLSAAESVLTAAGFEREPAWGRRPHRLWRRPLPGGGCVKVDVVTEIAFGRHHKASTDLASMVLARRRIAGGIAVPDPSDRQWLVLLHALLDRGTLAPRHRAALTPWAGRQDGVGGAVPLPVRRVVGRLAAAGSWDELERIAPALWASLAHGPDTERTRVAWRSAMRRSVEPQRALVRPGTTVAVLGVAGAGKTSVVRALSRELPDARLVYLGAYPKDAGARWRPAGLDILERCVRLAARGAVAERHRRRGRTVLLDRHPLEVTFGAPSSSLRTRVRRWLVAHTIAAPDVLVVLDAPAEVLHARKRDHALETVVAMRQRYRRLAAACGGVVIDADRPLPEVVTDVREAIARGQPRRSRG